MKRLLATVAATLMIGGCSATPPVTGNETGGLIDLSLAYPNDKVLAAADAHCAKYGKVAHLTKGRSTNDHNGAFECVAGGTG